MNGNNGTFEERSSMNAEIEPTHDSESTFFHRFITALEKHGPNQNWEGIAVDLNESVDNVSLVNIFCF